MVYHPFDNMSGGYAVCLLLYGQFVYYRNKNKCIIVYKMRRRILLNASSGGGGGTGKIGDYEVVDLGLSNGLLFATCNVGATNETNYGNYYMYGKGSRKYHSSDSPYTGTENPLASSADTATQVMGEGWRMPTESEFRDLIAKTNYEWVTDFNGSGINGGKFTSNTNPNAYVFFPAAGQYYNGSLYGKGSYGCVWSTTPYNSNSVKYLSFGDGCSIGAYNRSYGFSVRGVYEPAPLEVAFYNGSEIVIRKQSDWKNEETPIGIVVVPGYHNRYGDGTCGIMSLVGMDCNHPTSGIPITGASQTDNVYMYWGHYNANVGNNIFLSTVPNGKDAYYIPYQASSDSTATTTTTTSTYVQWPYAGTSTAPTSAKSETSDVTVPSMNATTGHAFGDFNGIKNTAACYVKTRTAAQWTASTVTNATGTTNTPAAACAGRFKTVGTKSFYDVYKGITSGSGNYGTIDDGHDYKGMWYLPAEGELCYLPSKRYEINKTILALNQKYGNVGVQLGTNNFYWSSSEYLNNNAWLVLMDDGLVSNRNKDSNSYVRAFLRL